MFVRKLLTLLFIITLAAFQALPCGAADKAVLSQAYAWNQYIDVYAAGELDFAKAVCKVSNQTAKAADSGSLTDKGITVRTTILIDVSNSIPPELRSVIGTFMDSMIENIGKNEEYRLVTIGEKQETLQDFTSDRYELSKAVGKLSFDAGQSKIYDAIYNTIPEIQPIDGKPCYYRTIVITDGIDETASGITKEELYLRLQKEVYPINVVALNSGNQPENEKELAALTRISGGSCYELYPDTDTDSLTAALSAVNIVWLRIEVPSALTDGSTRQISISDGTNSLEFDFKLPAYESDDPSLTFESLTFESVTSGSETDASEAQPQGTEPSSVKLPLSDVFGEYTAVAYIFALVLAAAVAFLIILLKGKKKNTV